MSVSQPAKPVRRAMLTAARVMRGSGGKAGTGAKVKHQAPDARLRAVADDYMRQTGRGTPGPAPSLVPIHPARARMAARDFGDMAETSRDRLTMAAYAALARETIDQYRALRAAGYKFDFYHPEKHDPYAKGPSAATDDLRDRGRMSVYPTAAGFGTEAPTHAGQRHPLMADTGEKWGGEPVYQNDVFRAVHDAFGHAKEGIGFRAPGEENAYRQHAQMFTPLARMALASETRGQNSWLNYGPYGAMNQKASTLDAPVDPAKRAEVVRAGGYGGGRPGTIFADQKAGIMPVRSIVSGTEDFLPPDHPQVLSEIARQHGRAGLGAFPDWRPGRAAGGAVSVESPPPSVRADARATPAFREWFGNSVAHDDGVPRRYFHGTSKDKDFDKFNIGRHGAWFTTDPKDASMYAAENDSQTHRYEGGEFRRTNTAARVIPAYLRLENPHTGDLPESLRYSSNYKKAQSDWFDALRARGHDSWVPASQKGALAVALGDPAQIKSAISNTGAYDPRQGRIGRDAGGQVMEQQPGTQPELPGVDVYHGSPYHFDKFDLGKIGTGEGNQAYGRGLYFAQDEGIARGYRDRLSRNKDPRIDLGIGRGPQSVDEITAADKLHQDHMFTLMDFVDAGGDWDRLHKKVEEDFYPKSVPKFQQHVREMRAKYPDAKLHKDGAMYHVRLNADPDHFLHWDKSLNDQHPIARKGFEELMARSGMTGDISKLPKIGELYRTMEGRVGKARAAQILQGAGVPGIRYLDANSRSGKKDAHNFVVFDDTIPEVKRRYRRGGKA